MSLKGRKQSPEHIAKRVAAMRASGAFEKAAALITERNKARTGYKKSAEVIERQRAKMMGRATAWLTGRKQTEEHRRNVAKYWAENPEKHNHYVDGKSAERTTARQTDMGRIEYRLWREKVFERDNWTCKHCGVRGGKLVADHIKPYSTHPELRYDVDNGQVLCNGCHYKTPTFGAGAKKEALRHKMRCDLMEALL